MRKYDSGWRDARVNLFHYGLDLPMPFAGSSLTMVEYDRGEALATINYVRRDVDTARGPDVVAAYQAIGRLRGPYGTQLPFITAVYDPRNWAFRLFGHNDAARNLLGTDRWMDATEKHFARQLYRLRGRALPDLASYGVFFNNAPWAPVGGTLPKLGWPGQDISARRREYEPESIRNGLRVNAEYNMRLPCADIDMAVVGEDSGSITLFVDFKLANSYIYLSHPTHKAMSGIQDEGDVPSVVAIYDPDGVDGRWKFTVCCLNEAARNLVSDAADGLDQVWVAEPEGVTYPMPEESWVALLGRARSL